MDVQERLDELAVLIEDAKAMPLSAGIDVKSLLNASRPPAEAPMPATGGPGDKVCKSTASSAGAGEGSAGVVFRLPGGLTSFGFLPADERFAFFLAAMETPSLLTGRGEGRAMHRLATDASAAPLRSQHGNTAIIRCPAGPARCR